VSLGVVASVACNSHNVRGNALEIQRDTAGPADNARSTGTGPVTVGNFQHRGTNSGLRSRWPPAMVQVTVTVTNIGPEAAPLDVLGGNCAVRLRIYPANRGARAAHPVFDATQQGYECYVALLHQSVKSGQSVTLQSAGDGPGIRLSPGRYFLTGVVTVVPVADSLRRHGAQLVEVPAGSIRVPEPYE
jgi:hypothetical protein